MEYGFFQRHFESRRIGTLIPEAAQRASSIELSGKNFPMAPLTQSRKQSPRGWSKISSTVAPRRWS